MRKIARIRIPMKKLLEVEAEWYPWATGDHPGSNWSACIFEDDESFLKNDKIIQISGDSDVINPVIMAIMDVIRR